MTEYRIFFADARATDIRAAKVYFGWKRFYLYDELNNVVGCFSWEELSGFQTTSAPVQQIILQDHDELPQNRKVKTEDKEEALKKQKGELLYELENLTAQLKEVSFKLSSAWLTVDKFRRTRTNELAVLLEHSRGEIQRTQAELSDKQKDIDKNLKELIDQISRALKGDSKI